MGETGSRRHPSSGYPPEHGKKRLQMGTTMAVTSDGKVLGRKEFVRVRTATVLLLVIERRSDDGHDL